MGRPRGYATNAERQRAYRARQRAQLQAPCVQIGDRVTLYQGDARTIAPLLQGIDALITDPPYGTAYDFTKARVSHTPLQGVSAAARWHTNILGDDQPFDPADWLSYRQIILWGAQHFASRLPDSGAWLVWDKRDGSTPDSHADCELAWTNLPGVSRLHRQKWRGIIRAGKGNVVHGGKLHQGQKPIELMQWCVAKTTGVVLDPYMGSGTTGEACLLAGRAFVGIELDPHAFDDARKHLEEVYKQRDLFLDAPTATPDSRMHSRCNGNAQPLLLGVNTSCTAD
jgi:site-specific DNA-methyltransferase (adenine-specific)/modification methylase